MLISVTPFHDVAQVLLSMKPSMTTFHDIPKVLHSVIADVFRYAFRDDYSVMLHKHRFP